MSHYTFIISSSQKPNIHNCFKLKFSLIAKGIFYNRYIFKTEYTGNFRKTLFRREINLSTFACCYPITSAKFEIADGVATIKATK